MPPKTSSTQLPSDAPATRGTRVRPVPAVTRSIAILRLLGQAKQGLGVKAIADALELVPSTCLHILRVLVAEDLVRVEPGSKRYTLGSGMISLARSVLEVSGFPQLAQPALDRLAASFGVTAMGVEVTAKQAAVVLALSRSSQPFRVHTDVGSQFASLVSATGRLIAAHSGETWPQLRKKFAAITWDQAPSFEDWKQEVEQARVRGWSLDRDHFMAGLTVVAVPVFASPGRLTHTLVAVGLTSQLTPEVVGELAGTMKHEAQAVAAQMLGRG